VAPGGGDKRTVIEAERLLSRRDATLAPLNRRRLRALPLDA